MAKYLISFRSAAMVVPDGEGEAVGRDARAVIEEAKAAGVYVFGAASTKRSRLCSFRLTARSPRVATRGRLHSPAPHSAGTTVARGSHCVGRAHREGVPMRSGTLSPLAAGPDAPADTLPRCVIRNSLLAFLLAWRSTPTFWSERWEEQVLTTRDVLMWSTATLWFDAAVVLAIFAFGNILFGHFEAHKPKWKRVLKVVVFLAVILTLSASVGRVWSMGLLGVVLLGAAYIHLVWLPRHGVNGLTGEPRQRYYELIGYEPPPEARDSEHAGARSSPPAARGG